jgi:phospholipid transport system substrate-binding protein
MLSFRRSIRPVFFGAAAALMFMLTTTRADAVSDTASSAVDRFGISVIAAVKGDGAASSPEGRYRNLSNLVSESFNLPFMMESATGARWRSATDDDRNRLTDAFLRMSIGTYLTRFEDYTGEYFVVMSEQPNIDGTTRVVTRLVRPRRPDLAVTYVTQKFEDGWRIVDIMFGGGISELTVRKSEFAGALSRGGLANLIVRLNEQADKMLASLGVPDRPGGTSRAVAAGEPVLPR